MIDFNILSTLQYYFRPLLKWFLRKTTGLCELQRICYGDPIGYTRTQNVEKSLMLSRVKAIQDLIFNLDKTVHLGRFVELNFPCIVVPSANIVMRVKKINASLHPTFSPSFQRCIEKIWSYKQLIHEAEELRKTQYDSSDQKHEEKLWRLWSALMPNEKLNSRITKQWQKIGFQGDDPKTDFRGMGLLGLENLLFFAEEYNKAAIHVLSHSKHPVFGYTFAIVGINLTSMALSLLKDGSAKTYMFNDKNHLPGISLFHRFYCFLFYEFDRIWIESKPNNIMEFPNIFMKFENSIKMKLADPNAFFKINLKIDTV